MIIEKVTPPPMTYEKLEFGEVFIVARNPVFYWIKTDRGDVNVATGRVGDAENPDSEVRRVKVRFIVEE